MDSPAEEFAIFTEVPSAVSIIKVPEASVFLISASLEEEIYLSSRDDDPTFKTTSSLIFTEF